MSLLDLLEAPEARSARSTRPTDSPRAAASRAAPGAGDPAADHEQVDADRPRARPATRAGARGRGVPECGAGPWGSRESVETGGAARRRGRGGGRAGRRSTRAGPGRGTTGSARGPAMARAAAATLGCRPAPAAASIAAPRAVVSTSWGRLTGSPVTSARRRSRKSPRAPPPTQTIAGAGVAGGAIASTTSRRASALPSSSARARWARPCAAVSPNHPARALAFHSGAIAPDSAGIQHTPSAPGRRAEGQRVEQLVDVGAGRRGARHLGAAELVAKPAVGAARQPARVLQQPAVGHRVRVQLDHGGCVDLRCRR